MQNRIFMKMNQSHCSIEVFHQCRAVLHPVAAIQIPHVADHLDLRAMDVTANDAIRLLFARHLRYGLLVVGGVFDRLLGLELQIRRQRPVTEPQTATNTVQIQIQIQKLLIEPRADAIEQSIEMRQAIALMAVDNKITFAVGTRMDKLPRQRHAAKAQADEVLHEFVVIADDVYDARLLAALAKQFLNKHIVFVAPKPLRLQFPPINEIANDVKILTFAVSQEIQQRAHLGVSGAQVYVGDPHGTEAPFGGRRFRL